MRDAITKCKVALKVAHGRSFQSRDTFNHMKAQQLAPEMEWSPSTKTL